MTSVNNETSDCGKTYFVCVACYSTISIVKTVMFVANSHCQLVYSIPNFQSSSING